MLFISTISIYFASIWFQVGVLLLDNQGMFDGLITDGEIIPISGISLAISFLQIFNVEKKITTDCLENIVVSKNGQ